MQRCFATFTHRVNQGSILDEELYQLMGWVAAIKSEMQRLVSQIIPDVYTSPRGQQVSNSVFGTINNGPMQSSSTLSILVIEPGLKRVRRLEWGRAIRGLNETLDFRHWVRIVRPMLQWYI